MSGRITVVLSQGQSRHPDKRGLEEKLVAELIGRPHVDLVVIPNLYDLSLDDSALLALEGISGPMIVLSWHYSRAAFWTLAQLGIRGKLGATLLVSEADEAGEDGFSEGGTSEEGGANGREDERATLHGAGSLNRRVYCIDLRASEHAGEFLEEIERIRRDVTTKVVTLSIVSDAVENSNGAVVGESPAGAVVAPPRRRWYPVIDYNRCTNCMECIDFCLFGVYGVDAAEQILVEQPDNCRKGCPACSRVCPENAIIFPQHKSPAIAGGAIGDSGLKIDLSQLFGAPSAQEVAARERDEQLMLAGRTPVGQIQRERDEVAAERNELDDMLDELDAMEL